MAPAEGAGSERERRQMSWLQMKRPSEGIPRAVGPR